MQFNLPPFCLSHLFRMTDSAGMLQHAKFTVPDFSEGYCTDDNARALTLTVLLEELDFKIPELTNAASTYIAFLNYALNRNTGRFRNFLSFARQWTESEGSEDCQGRAIWALGTCVGRTRDENMERLAGQLLEKSLSPLAQFTSPRSWAFALIGIHEYFRRLSGDRSFEVMRETLTDKLLDAFEKNIADDWVWCEDVVAYSNAKLPHALLLSGQWTDRPDALEMGLKSLRWLIEIQTTSDSHFRPVGCNGFYRRGQKPAEFDQQPIEAYTMISACAEAFRITSDHYWLSKAQMVFDWFLGRNDLGVHVYDAKTGACRDALHVDRVNQNEGAESTLAFMLALAEMNLLQNSTTV